MAADGDGTGGADAVAGHREKLKVGAVISTGAKADGAGFFCEPDSDFQLVGGAGFAAAEMVAGHVEDVGFDVLLADGGKGGRDLCVSAGYGCGDEEEKELIFHSLR